MAFRPVLVGALVVGLALSASSAFADAPPTALDAQRLAFEGDLDKAIEAAKAAFAASPTAPTGRLLQDLLRDAGRSGERATVVSGSTPELVRQGLVARLRAPKPAVAALTELLKTEDAPECFRLDLALAHVRNGRPTAGSAEAERYVKGQPDAAEGHLVLAETLVAREKYSAARDAFERVLEISPGHPQATVGRVAMLVKTKAGGRRQALEKALGIYPNSPVLRLGLAEDQVRKSELEEATATLQAVLALPVPKGAVHTRLSELWRLRRKYAEAEKSAAAALADKMLQDEDRARALRTRGFTKQKKKDLRGARADYEAALELAPDWAQLHADLGFVLALSEDLKTARKCIEKALKLDKELTDAHLKYGIVLFLAGKTREAKRELGLVLKEDADSLPANRYMGYAMLEEGKPKAAIKHFQKVADLDPEDANSVRMIGRAQLARGKVEEALVAFREAVRLDPEDGFTYFDLGKALEKKEAWDDAETAYRKAIEVEEELAYPHLYLAELLDYVQGEPSDALEHYERYLELGGGDEDGAIRKRIEQLKR